MSSVVEDEQYDQAVSIIEDLKPEPDITEIEVTTDNWQEYLELREIHEIKDYDAEGNITKSDAICALCLKEEYDSAKGELEIGYNISYSEDSYRLVHTVDTDTGDFEIDRNSDNFFSIFNFDGNGYVVKETNSFIWDTSYIDDVSERDVYYSNDNGQYEIICYYTWSVRKDLSESDCYVRIKDFEDFYTIAVIPNIDIIYVNGTLTVAN